MRNLRRVCAAVALACVFTAAAHAGDMHAGVTNPPPPPPPSVVTEATTQGEIECGVAADVLAALLGLLSAF